MSNILDFAGIPVWCKVDHPNFDASRAYRSLGYLAPYAETGWGYHVFITESGHTFAIQVWRCTALPRTCELGYIDHAALNRGLTATEELFPWAKKPAVRNPDMNTDL